MMKAREEEINNIIEFLSEKTEGFEKPKLIPSEAKHLC